VLGAVLDPLQHCSGGWSSCGAAGAVFSDILMHVQNHVILYLYSQQLYEIDG